MTKQNAGWLAVVVLPKDPLAHPRRPLRPDRAAYVTRYLYEAPEEIAETRTERGTVPANVVIRPRHP